MGDSLGRPGRDQGRHQQHQPQVEAEPAAAEVGGLGPGQRQARQERLPDHLHGDRQHEHQDEHAGDQGHGNDLTPYAGPEQGEVDADTRQIDEEADDGVTADESLGGQPGLGEERGAECALVARQSPEKARQQPAQRQVAALEFEVPPPADFEALLKALREDLQ